jgi:hypothetical protein
LLHLTICFPESDGAANHTSGNKNNQQFPPLTSKIPRFKPLWRWYYIEGYDKFDGKFNAVAMQAEERNDYWGLMVDYAPGSKVYSWALFPTARSGRPNGRMISGEGAASQIAEQVCIVVTGRGASVR